jgi:hypothetical protein
MRIMMSSRTNSRATQPAPRAAGWLLLLAAVGGCETSNAVVPSMPNAGQGMSALPATSGGTGAATAPSGSGASGSAAPTAPASGGQSAVSTAGQLATGGAGQSGSSNVNPLPVAGSAPVPVTTTAGTGVIANGDCRPAKYSLSSRITMDVTWPETLGLMGGTGKAYFWYKVTLQQSGGTITTEQRYCGGQLPVYMGSALANNIKVFQQAPQASFDNMTMPRVAGTASKVSSMLKLEPGAMLIGITLTDPQAAWPASASAAGVKLVDAEADGKPGLTLVMKSDGGFTGSPTSVLQTERVDQNYAAYRLTYTASAADPSCADTLEGSAEVLAFDQMILGCHVSGRGDCTADEATFIDDNRPKFQRGKATWMAKVIADDATCAQAREALAVPGP